MCDFKLLQYEDHFELVKDFDNQQIVAFGKTIQETFNNYRNLYREYILNPSENGSNKSNAVFV